MNQRAADSLEGFSELLQIAGEDLTWGGIAFTALIRTSQPDPQHYDLSVGDDDAVIVRAFLGAFPGSLPTVGTSFEGALGTLHRVRRVTRTPGSPIIIFECEVAHP